MIRSVCNRSTFYSFTDEETVFRLEIRPFMAKWLTWPPDWGLTGLRRTQKSPFCARSARLQNTMQSATGKEVVISQRNCCWMPGNCRAFRQRDTTYADATAIRRSGS